MTQAAAATTLLCRFVHLAMPSNSTDSLLGRLGLRYEHRFAEISRTARFELFTGWEHQFLDADDINGAFTSGGKLSVKKR